MDGHLIVLLPVAGVWLAAGILADRLPRLDRARALRRRTGWLLALTLTGLGLTAGVLAAGLQSAGTGTVDRAAAGLALAATPALLVGASTARRVRRLWTGAGALATAPHAPAPHGLRAAAAHPLVGLPLQVTGLATIPGVLSASGLDVFAGPGTTGAGVTIGALGVVAIGVRHALRHSRLAERALPQRQPASPRAASPLHV
ncbi:hypothetical protein OOK41_02230 [Micromonospora sp. NBC_01655]|uniref:hypothetical protein n=1 Tax=Micromonospora sp. NBC_01655 TaxID=2975983 RepID=UPI002250827E|nr:hypothetical protein [Micromonospora sp. NBC_01655]MCX4469142.1 hypothetical protein [Micromonospora sp. NBC_01655]